MSNPTIQLVEAIINATEGVFRWTIDTVNPVLVKHGGQEIIGTGNAPLLSPSKANIALLLAIADAVDTQIGEDEEPTMWQRMAYAEVDATAVEMEARNVLRDDMRAFTAALREAAK